MNHKENTDYVPLLMRLADHWRHPFEKIPEGLKPAVVEAFGGGAIWDGLSVAGRRQQAWTRDQTDDPARESGMLWRLLAYREQLRAEIAKLDEQVGRSAEIVALRKVEDELATWEFLDRGAAGADLRQVRGDRQSLLNETHALRQQLAERDRELGEVHERLSQCEQRVKELEPLALAGVITPLTRILLDARLRHYVNIRPDDPTSYPRANDVTQEIQKKGVSNRVASAMVTILTPEDAPKGRRPNLDTSP